MFLDAWHEFFDINQASTSIVVQMSSEGPILGIPERLEQLLQRKSTAKVSKLKYLFKSCVALIEDKDAMEELAALVEEPQINVRLEKKVNHIGKDWKLVMS